MKSQRFITAYRCPRGCLWLHEHANCPHCGGRLTGAWPTLKEVRTKVRQGLEQLDHTYRRIINPHVYKVSLSGALKDLKYNLIERYTRREGKP